MDLATSGRWLMLAVLGVFALIGFLQITRGTAVRHVHDVAEGTPVAISDPRFPLSVNLLTGAWLAAGNHVEVMLDGDGTFPRLWSDLQSAQQSITLQLYYKGAGRMASTLAGILADRARAGVRVLLLYDAFGASSIPSGELNAMRAAGVQAQPFRPIGLSTLHLAQNRSHVRGIVIDGRIAWTGGFGIDDKWYGDGRTHGAWRETNVRFEGPAVRQLQATFAAGWVEATGVLLTAGVELAEHQGGALAGLLHTSPTLGSTPAERFFALSIASARESIYITNSYFSPDRNFIELLTSAARRGVDVRILTAGTRTDVPVVRFAGRRWYETLLAAGVRVYEWQPTTMHAKTFVIDGSWVTIGSMNFGNRSMALNDEATLMVLDRTIGQQMTEVFFDDLRHCTAMTREHVRARSWSERPAEWGASLITRLL